MKNDTVSVIKKTLNELNTALEAEAKESNIDLLALQEFINTLNHQFGMTALELTRQHNEHLKAATEIQLRMKELLTRVGEEFKKEIALLLKKAV